MIIENKKFNFDFNKLIIDSKFNDIIDELKSINISLPDVGRHWTAPLQLDTFRRKIRLVI